MKKILLISTVTLGVSAMALGITGTQAFAQRPADISKTLPVAANPIGANVIKVHKKHKRYKRYTKRHFRRHHRFSGYPVIIYLYPQFGFTIHRHHRHHSRRHMHRSHRYHHYGRPNIYIPRDIFGRPMWDQR